MKVCIVSTEYAFEYPLGDFCYPFRVLAQELTKRDCEVTVLCLGPDLDIVHQGVRLRAVGVNAKPSRLKTLGFGLQVWEYLGMVRDSLLGELSTLSSDKPFDVIEACAQVLGKPLLDLPSAFVLRLDEAELPNGSATTERDLNLRLIRIKQSQAVTVADSIISDRPTKMRQNDPSNFAGEQMLEHLSFDIPDCPPAALLPKNGSQSVFIAQWFKVAEARQQTLDVLEKLAKTTNDFRFIFPCDCTAKDNDQQHRQDVAAARDQISQAIGSSAKLWIVHNLKAADLATCLSGCEVLFVPDKAGFGFHFLGGFYGTPTVAACTDEHAGVVNQVDSISHKLQALLSEQFMIDESLAGEVRASLAGLVASRINAYKEAATRLQKDLRTQFVDDSDNLVLEMDRLAGNLSRGPSLTDKIKNKVRRVLTSAGGSK